MWSSVHNAVRSNARWYVRNSHIRHEALYRPTTSMFEVLSHTTVRHAWAERRVHA